MTTPTTTNPQSPITNPQSPPARATGPTTPEGKAIAARNSTKHGLRARAIVLPNESQDEWDEFEDAFVSELNPVGIVEEALARRAAELQWRLRRVAAAERAAMDECAEDPLLYKPTAKYRREWVSDQPGFFPDRLPETMPAATALNPLMRYEAHLSRQYQQVMRDLLAAQDRRIHGAARVTRLEVHGFRAVRAAPAPASATPKLPNELHAVLPAAGPPTQKVPNEIPSAELDALSKRQVQDELKELLFGDTEALLVFDRLFSSDGHQPDDPDLLNEAWDEDEDT